MLKLPQRAWCWVKARTPFDDQGFETSEIMLITAAGGALILTLMGRMGDILNRVVTYIDTLLPG